MREEINFNEEINKKMKEVNDYSKEIAVENKKDKERLFKRGLLDEAKSYRTSDFRETVNLLSNNNCLALKDLYYLVGNRKVNMKINNLKSKKMTGILKNTAKVVAISNENIDLEKAKKNHRIATSAFLLREFGIKLDMVVHNSYQFYSSKILINDNLTSDVVLFDIDSSCSNASLPHFIRENAILLRKTIWIVSINKENERYANYYVKYISDELEIDRKNVIVNVINDRKNECELKLAKKDSANLVSLTEDNIKTLDLEKDNEDVIDLINFSYKEFEENNKIYDARFNKNKK